MKNSDRWFAYAYVALAALALLAGAISVVYVVWLSTSVIFLL